MPARRILFTAIIVALIFTIQPLWAAEPDEAEKVPLKGSGSYITLPLSSDLSISLTSFIEVAGKQLGFPIAYPPISTNDHTLTFTAEVKIPSDGFLGFFERLLLDHGFLHLVSGKGDSEIHQVVSVEQTIRAQQTHIFQSSAILVPYDKLNEYARRGTLITTSVPLEHIRARECMTTIQIYFQSHFSNYIEWVRPLESANRLIISGPASKVCKVCDLIKLSDVPVDPNVDTDLKSRVKQLEAKVDALMKMLEEKKEGE